MEDWPTRLLTHRDWAYAESPFDAIPPIPLDDIWVSLHFLGLEEASRTSFQGTLHESLELRYKDRLSVAVAPEFVLERLHGFVALIGDPGIGKTTFLKWVARQLIRRSEGRYLLPLFVPLRRYVLAGRDDGMLRFALSQCGVRDTHQQELWENALVYLSGTARETVLLLLDGWDEVPIDRRDALLQEISDLSYGFTILLTSRPSAYPLSLSANRYYEITELSPESTMSLIDRWFASVGHPEQADRLLDHLDAHPDLRWLARNPFLLTILCGISHHGEGTSSTDLPTTRTELYHRTVDGIRVNQTRRSPNYAFNDERQRQVERLALWLFAEAPGAPRYVFDSGDVEASGGSLDLLDRVLRPSKLLNQWDLDKETLHFIHTTFHEYLVACALLQRPPEDMHQILDAHTYDSAWQEVFAFVAGSSLAVQKAFWAVMSTVARNPDRFGIVLLRLARFIREAKARDGGATLLGIDIREQLWERIQQGIQTECFINCCAELDSSWYVERCQRYMETIDNSVNSQVQQVELILSMDKLRTPETSRLLVKQLLTDSEIGLVSSCACGGLTTEGINTLRQELVNPRRSTIVRDHIIRTLGYAKDYKSIPLLAQIARNDPDLKKSALETLADIGGIQAFQELDALLCEATDPENWSKVIEALGLMREPRARNRLLDVLANCSLDDRAAETILGGLIDHPISKDSAIVIDFLHQSPWPNVRAKAARVLHLASEAGIADALVTAAQEDTSEEVRDTAIASLRVHARPVDVPWLSQYALDITRNPRERAYALEAVFRAVSLNRDRPDGPSLLTLAKRMVAQLLKDYEAHIRLAATQLSYHLGNDIAPQLIAICDDDDEADDVREKACESLGKLKYTAATDTLLQLQRETSPDA